MLFARIRRSRLAAALLLLATPIGPARPQAMAPACPAEMPGMGSQGAGHVGSSGSPTHSADRRLPGDSPVHHGDGAGCLCLGCCVPIEWGAATPSVPLVPSTESGRVARLDLVREEPLPPLPDDLQPPATAPPIED